ncbi:MAG: GGDEF domain-containing protein [Lachnospiraceae bacterium]|nr:GGDEF domain-containing protein [Lachnospiraceae bacterium]
MGDDKQIHIGCMFWNYMANRTQQLVKELWKMFEEKGISVSFYIGTENHFYQNEVMDAGSKYDYQYSSLSAYSRYEDFDLLIVSGGTLTISRTKEEADEVLNMLPKVPTIFLENKRDCPYVRSQILDNGSGISECTEHLITEHGCKRIAFISGPKENQSAIERKEAFFKTMDKYGLEFDEADFVQGNYGASIDELIEPLFRDGGHPDAIVSSNDEMALSVYRVAEKHGCKIGEDVLVTGFDDISVAEYLDPPLTTIRQDFHDMSEQVVELAMEMLSGKMPDSYVYHPKMIIRGSCGCKKCSEKAENKSADEGSDKLINRFVELQNMRQRLLSGANLNRAMLNAGNRKRYLHMIASLMEIEQLSGARLLLTDPYRIIQKGDPIWMPEELKVIIECRDGISHIYDEDKAPIIHLDKHEPDNSRLGGCNVALLLFFEQFQYGIMELEIKYEEIEHYYIQALEIGLGLRYLDLVSAEQTARRRLEENNRKLDYQANHDALTAVLNRTGFLREENRILERNIGSNIAVLMADLDHLKQINDTYGHGEGDHAIRLTTEVLENVLGDYKPVIGRTGGDEFSVIFTVPDDFDPNDCVEKIHKYCDDLNEGSGLPYYLGVSAGCLKFEAKKGLNLRELFTEADILMYADKKRRRNMVLRD